MKVLSVFGTRPEAIKMAPVLVQLKKRTGIMSRVCVTAQHREMLDQVLSLFCIGPDHDLDIMRANQGLSYVTSQVLNGVEEVIIAERPDWVLVQGDTTTTMAASLAAFYHGVAVAHIEAGLRTGDRRNPFPEEINRRVADILADLHFAPTEVTRRNLLREGIPSSSILVTGNTIVDALQCIMAREVPTDSLRLPTLSSLGGRLILVTVHRRESFGRPLGCVCGAVERVAIQHAPECQILFPVHPNPHVHEAVYRRLRGVSGVTLTEPLDYDVFLQMLNRAYLVITDSGGIQEEATALGKPVIVVRDRTERTEAIDAGNARLVGTQEEAIVEEVERLLRDSGHYRQMSRQSQVYGDGRASERIVEALLARWRH